MKVDKHPRSMALIAIAVGVFVIGVILTIAFWDQDALLGVGITMAVIGIGIVLLGCINLQAQRGKMGGGLRGQVTDDKTDANAPRGPAPRRVPPRTEYTLRDGTFIDGEDSEDGNGLVYDEFSASPSPNRAIRLADGTVIGHGDGTEMGFSPAGGDGVPAGYGPGDARSASVAGVVPSGTTYVSITPVGDDTAAKRAAAMRRDGGPLFPLSPFDQRSFPVPAAAHPHANNGKGTTAHRHYSDAAAESPDARGSTTHHAGFASPGAMGSDAENTPPPAFAPGGSSRPLGPAHSPMTPGGAGTHASVRMPANSNAPYTTTTTTTVTGSGMRHRTAHTGASSRPMPTHGGLEDSPPPPRREMPTGYDARAHGFTPDQLDAEIAKHRDDRYESHLAAVDALHESFQTPQGDDDALPADYWSRRAGPARTVKFD